MYPLRQNQDPVPRLHYCSLTAPPFSLYPLPSLISNYLNLPFGNQGRSWKLKPIPYKQEMGTQKGFRTQEPHKVLLGFISPHLWLGCVFWLDKHQEVNPVFR